MVHRGGSRKAGRRLLAAGIGAGAVLALLGAPPASAAGSGVVRISGTILLFTAAAGHVNDIDLVARTSLDGSRITVVFTDSNPITTTAPGCRVDPPPAGRSSVTCVLAPSQLATVMVDAADLDDRVVSEEDDRPGDAEAWIWVTAGSGNDVVTMDHVSSRAGWRDVVDGGPGNDLIVSDEGDDHLIGGTGSDTVSYELRQTQVTASLAAGSGGQVDLGERDTYTGIENLSGGGIVSFGYGQDVLVGDNGPNRIETRAPATIFGLDGDDVLVGAPSHPNWISGGGGRDLLFDGRATDHLQGDAGDDACWVHSSADVVLTCERRTLVVDIGP